MLLILYALDRLQIQRLWAPLVQHTFLELNPIDAQVGLQSWRALQEASPDVRCLQVGLILTLISDKISYLVSFSSPVSLILSRTCREHISEYSGRQGSNGLLLRCL